MFRRMAESLFSPRCPRRWRSTAAAIGILAITPALATSPANAPGPERFSTTGWPLFFVAAPISANSGASFLARGQNYQLWIRPNEVDFSLSRPALPLDPTSIRREPPSFSDNSSSTRFVKMVLNAANPRAHAYAAAEMEGRVNYLLGSDATQWRTGIPMFAQVRIEDAYPGIDLLYYGNQHQLEYDFVVSSNADPGKISFRFEGVDALKVEATGELVLRIGQAEMQQHKPVIYQFVKGVRRQISGGYALRDAKTVGFEVGEFDHNYPLVIDPVFSYSTYFGGNAGDTGLAIKVDANGSVYLAGETLSTQFPAAQSTAPFQSQMHGGKSTGDAFIAKLDNTGSKLLYFTYLGGSSDDGAYDLAIDAAGNAYLTGFTVSPDFPTHNAIFPQISGSADPIFHLYPLEAFVAELNTNGSALIYSTYLGGSNKEIGNAIAVDPAGYTYVTGLTYSTNFPVLNALQTSLGGIDDVFVTKLAPGGKSLVYSTYLGGRSIDEGEGIAADAAGYAYVSGYTASTNFPITVGALQTSLNGSGDAVTLYDAFVTRISPNGRSFVYSTYLGGDANDYGYRIAVDTSANAYVTGATQSTNFPHSTSFNLALGENGSNASNFDAFLIKLDGTGKRIYSAQFGGTANDSGWDVALDSSGRAFVIGTTLSTDFPVAHPFDLFRANNAGGQDIFVVAFDTNEAPVLYSAYLGGSGADYGYGITIDREANAYITGMTLSTNFPTTHPFESALSGSSDAFVAKIRLFSPVLTVQQSGTAFLIAWPATAPDYLLQSTTDLTAPQVWTAVPQAPILTNGQYTVTVTSSNVITLFRLSRR
jgi:hypothetical protein